MDISQDIPDPNPQLETIPIPMPCWQQWVCATPTGAFSSSTQSLQFPQGLSNPYPEVMPQEGFPPGFSYSQTANSTKSRMQAQSSASAMLWLHTAYTGATPGILTPLPKPAKGMREKLVAWKKKEQHLELLSGTAETAFICSRLHETFPI